MPGGRIQALLLAGLVAGSSSIAFAAADDAERARALSKKGLEDFNHGRYPQAIESFLASYAIAPMPALIFDSAQAYRLAGQCAPALQLYRRYLHEAPDANNRAAVEARIGEMENCVPPAAPDPAPREAVAMSAPAPASATPAPMTPATTRARPSRPVYKAWWLWTSVGAVVAAGVVTGVVVASTRPPPFRPNLPDSGPGAHALVTVGF